MMNGHSLAATLPEETGLCERFWYWRGASGKRYIHSIYRPDLCPPVSGAVFVVVRVLGGVRRPVSVGRFGADGRLGLSLGTCGQPDEEEIHVHLLARDEEGAGSVLRDLTAAMTVPAPSVPEQRPWSKPVQLDLLAA